MVKKNKNPKIKSKNLTISQQILAMKTKFPHFSLNIINKGRGVIWRGNLQPSPLSEIYNVRVTYCIGSSPEVNILHPKLQDRSLTERVPHVYPGRRPCLYLPRENEWTAEKYISDTIIPWFSLWLYYYEVWLATGEWLGGGVHPSSENKESD